MAAQWPFKHAQYDSRELCDSVAPCLTAGVHAMTFRVTKLDICFIAKHNTTEFELGKSSQNIAYVLLNYIMFSQYPLLFTA